MAKHAVAFSEAADLVIDSSESAYRTANRLRYEENVAAAVDAYGQPGWKPSQELAPLLTPEQIAARIKVLDGLQTYAATLAQLEGKPSAKDKKALDAAASSIGTNLQALDKTVNTDFSKALAGAPATTTLPVITPMEASLASTALRGLGSYLIQRKLKQSLPTVIGDMNNNVSDLCKLMSHDIAILRREADVDYRDLINGEGRFIDKSGQTLDPGRRRDEIARLLELSGAQKANDQALAKLEKTIIDMALVHQALGAAAQQNNPTSIREKIAELIAAGRELGAFYSSLPAS